MFLLLFVLSIKFTHVGSFHFRRSNSPLTAVDLLWLATAAFTFFRFIRNGPERSCSRIICEEIPFQSLNSKLFLASRDNTTSIIDNEVKEIHPLDTLELILYQHLAQEYFSLFGDWVDVMWDLNF